MIEWNLTKRHSKWLLLAIGFWLIGDLSTTFAFLSVGIAEGNPIFYWLTLETFWMIIVIKIIAAIVAVLLINVYEKFRNCTCRVHKIFKSFYLTIYMLSFGFVVSIANLWALFRVV